MSHSEYADKIVATIKTYRFACNNAGPSTDGIELFWLLPDCRQITINLRCDWQELEITEQDENCLITYKEILPMYILGAYIKKYAPKYYIDFIHGVTQ